MTSQITEEALSNQEEKQKLSLIQVLKYTKRLLKMSVPNLMFIKTQQHKGYQKQKQGFISII